MNPGRSPRRAIALAAGVTVIATLPAHLTGALAVQLTTELHFGVAALGLAIGVLRGTSALLATYLGGLTDRLGTTRSTRLGAGCSMIAFAGISLTSRNW